MTELLLILTTILGAGTYGRGTFGITNEYWVDSVAGSDANPGTAGLPFATLGRVSSFNMTGGALHLARGSVFNESFEIPTNSIVDAYGSGAKPILTGTTNLANNLFVKTAGLVNTYDIPLVVPFETNKWIGGLVHSNVLVVLQDGLRLGNLWFANDGFGSGANVDANAGSFWYSNRSRLYIHPIGNSDPTTDGKRYEASIRTLNLHGGAGFTVSNIEARDCNAYNTAGNQGYQALGNAGGIYRNCVFHGGWNHVAGVANSIDWHGLSLTFDSCRIYDGDPLSGPVLAIAYHDTISTAPLPLVVFTNCLIYQPGGVNIGGSVGTYGHGGAVTFRVVGCTFTNLSVAMSASGEANNNNTVVACNTVFESFPDNLTISNLTAFESAIYSPNDGAQASGNILNSTIMAHSGQNLLTLDLPTTTWTLGITNCIFASTNNNCQVFKLGGGRIQLSLATNHFWKVGEPFLGVNNTATNIAFSDTNNFYLQTRMAESYPTNIILLAAWTNAYAKDLHSTTNDPGFAASQFQRPAVGDPAGP